MDLIITSPPYINVFNYHQNHRGIIESFGYDILRVAESEFGSNRKHRSNRFKTVVQYSMDMGMTIYEASKALKVGGKMILIVGRESNVRKTKFYNSKIILELIASIPSLILEDTSNREFINRYGEKIIEDIIIVRKENNVPELNIEKISEAVGLKQVEEALQYADESLLADLNVLLSAASQVQKSPIF